MTKKTKQQNMQEEPAKTDEIESTVMNPPVKNKSLFKRFLFFAIFVLCVEVAVLYPLVTQEERKPTTVVTPKRPALKQTTTTQVTTPCPECKCPEPQVVIRECELTPQEKNDAALIASLKEQVHSLEIENLSLKEAKTAFEDTTPVLIDLLQNIYTGKPFASQLDTILKQDKRNEFALSIQKKLGNYANKGIPTTDDVKHLFDSKFQVTLDSFHTTTNEQSYLSKAANMIKSMVHIYPENLSRTNAKGIDWLYLARKQVQNNDFAGAIESISHMPAQAKAQMKEFSNAAQIWLQAKNVIMKGRISK